VRWTLATVEKTGLGKRRRLHSGAGRLAEAA
jgi:hypothetical protein